MNLQTLFQEFRELYVQAYNLALVHDNVINDNLVPESYFSPWYQCRFSLADTPHMLVNEDSVEWYGWDNDGDSITMTVPICVLNGTTSAVEWGNRTYYEFQEYERNKAAACLKSLEHNKEQRREQYNKLKAEFDV